MDDRPVAGLAECQRHVIRAGESGNIQRDDRENSEVLHKALFWRRNGMLIARTLSAADLRARYENYKERHYESNAERYPLLGGKPQEPIGDETRFKVPHAQTRIRDTDQHQCRRNRDKHKNCLEDDGGGTRCGNARALRRVRRFLLWDFRSSDTVLRFPGTVYTTPS